MQMLLRRSSRATKLRRALQHPQALRETHTARTAVHVMPTRAAPN